MSQGRFKLQKWLFEHRVELASLTGGIGFLFFLFTPNHFTRQMTSWFALPEEVTVRGIYLFLAGVNLVSGIIRIWAGGILTGARMMAVGIQTDELITGGPYNHLRNPIYLADILTMAGMALVVPLPGSILTVGLLAFIYPQIMTYEEGQLSKDLGEPYIHFRDHVPRILPRISAYRPKQEKSPFSLKEGLVNNFIYLPLIPGFIACAITGTLWHGVAIGAAGPVGWVALHFWRNFKKGGLAKQGE